MQRCNNNNREAQNWCCVEALWDSTLFPHLRFFFKKRRFQRGLMFPCCSLHCRSEPLCKAVSDFCGNKIGYVRHTTPHRAVACRDVFTDWHSQQCVRALLFYLHRVQQISTFSQQRSFLPDEVHSASLPALTKKITVEHPEQKFHRLFNRVFYRSHFRKSPPWLRLLSLFLFAIWHNAATVSHPTDVVFKKFCFYQFYFISSSDSFCVRVPTLHSSSELQSSHLSPFQTVIQAAGTTCSTFL